jgi:hypothetical protein
VVWLSRHPRRPFQLSVGCLGARTLTTAGQATRAENYTHAHKRCPSTDSCSKTQAKGRLQPDGAMSAAKDAAVAAHGDGLTEVDLAQILSVNRMTIRKWLGKL